MPRGKSGRSRFPSGKERPEYDSGSFGGRALMAGPFNEQPPAQYREVAAKLFGGRKVGAMEEMKDPYNEDVKAQVDERAATAMNQSVHVHEKEDIEFLKPDGQHLPYPVVIQNVTNGYQVTVGCQTFFIDTRERLIRLLRRYLNDPMGMIKTVMPKSGSLCAPPPSEFNHVDESLRQYVGLHQTVRPEPPECCEQASEVDCAE